MKQPTTHKKPVVNHVLSWITGENSRVHIEYGVAYTYLCGSHVWERIVFLGWWIDVLTGGVNCSGVEEPDVAELKCHPAHDNDET